MARHRANESANQAQRDPFTGRIRAARLRMRGLAKWPIAVATLIVLLALSWAGWNWAESVATRTARAQAQATRCPEGPATLRVVVAPDIRGPVAAAARSWNRTGHVVHAHCVHTVVQAIPSAQVADALTGRTSMSTIDGLPAAWVPESERWLRELRQTRPGILGASGESIATAGEAGYPYVGLAGDGVSPTQARAAQSFRAYLLRDRQRSAFTDAGFGPPKTNT